MSTFVTELKKQHAEFMAKQGKQRVARQVEQSPLRNEDFYYTDAPKYANEYYGEVYRATTKFDNDWD
jgi:hypothetical protein